VVNLFSVSEWLRQ